MEIQHCRNPSSPFRVRKKVLKVAIPALNRQSPMTVPSVVNRPELVYVYEVAAEELAPLESEPSEQSEGEAYEESDLLRSFPSAETDYEPLPYEERRVGKECRSRWSPYH